MIKKIKIYFLLFITLNLLNSCIAIDLTPYDTGEYNENGENNSSETPKEIELPDEVIYKLPGEINYTAPCNGRIEITIVGGGGNGGCLEYYYDNPFFIYLKIGEGGKAGEVKRIKLDINRGCIISGKVGKSAGSSKVITNSNKYYASEGKSVKSSLYYLVSFTDYKSGRFKIPKGEKNSTKYGAGGDAGKKGKPGVVIIKWLDAY